jgi:hypothetical protein
MLADDPDNATCPASAVRYHGSLQRPTIRGFIRQTDWNNIMLTFQEATAFGEGSTVEFAAGDFYVDRPLQIRNFSGTVRGAGKGRTNLHTAPGVLFELNQPPLEPYSVYLVFFLDASWPIQRPQNLTISDLTFRIDGPSRIAIAHDPSNQNNCINVVEVRGRLTGVADFEVSHVNATFERLEAIGVDAGLQCVGTGYSIGSAIGVRGEGVVQIEPSGLILLRWYKPVTGTFVGRNIYFENSMIGIASIGAKDSILSFGGGPQRVL